jgi:hypothetical protein
MIRDKRGKTLLRMVELRLEKERARTKKRM